MQTPYIVKNKCELCKNKTELSKNSPHQNPWQLQSPDTLLTSSPHSFLFLTASLLLFLNLFSSLLLTHWWPPFTHIFCLPGSLYLPMCQVSLFFPFYLENFHQIFFKVDLSLTNYLSFHLSENVLISPFFQKDIFNEYWILG